MVRPARHGETFDEIEFDWNGKTFSDPRWTRLTREQVDAVLQDN